jgi:hypothetical protein
MTVEPNSPALFSSSRKVSLLADCAQAMILDNFSVSRPSISAPVIEAGCFLKTRTDRFKEHWAQVVGRDLLCFRKQGDIDYRVMHCLTGTYVEECKTESNPDGGSLLYPVKIVLPPNKSRILYFTEKAQQQVWYDAIRKVIGEQNVNDFYDITQTLGKGQFGTVKLAKHKKTKNLQAAIKTVTKSNMKPIEVYQQRREIEVLKMC